MTEPLRCPWCQGESFVLVVDKGFEAWLFCHKCKASTPPAMTPDCHAADEWREAAEAKAREWLAKRGSSDLKQRLLNIATYWSQESREWDVSPHGMIADIRKLAEELK